MCIYICIYTHTYIQRDTLIHIDRYIHTYKDTYEEKYIYIERYVYWPISLVGRVFANCLGVQSQVKSYQKLKKWYLISPCLTLSIIKYVSG